MTTRGRRALQLQVRHLVDLDEAVEVVCRQLARRYNSADALPFKVGKGQLQTMLKEELAFGGYEAYGHLWTDNFPGDDDDAAAFRHKVETYLVAAWPAWKEGVDG